MKTFSLFLFLIIILSACDKDEIDNIFTIKIEGEAKYNLKLKEFKAWDKAGQEVINLSSTLIESDIKWAYEIQPNITTLKIKFDTLFSKHKTNILKAYQIKATYYRDKYLYKKFAGTLNVDKNLEWELNF